MDYGCGKGGLVRALQEKFPDIKVRGYDPAVEEFENLPTEKFDLVVNTDVLEHIPEDELPETVERIKSLSDNVFFQLHHEKAVFVLPNGENAHCTIWTPQQYHDLFRKYFSTIVALPGKDNLHTICITFELSKEIEKKCKILIQRDFPYIDNLKDFVDLLQNNEEVIFIHGMRSGKNVLDYLEYSDNLEHVRCIATPAIKYVYHESDNIFDKSVILTSFPCLDRKTMYK